MPHPLQWGKQETDLFAKIFSGLVLSVAATLPGLALAEGAVTKACRVPDFPQEVQCGKVQRPLDPAHPEGRKIDINYVVVPSQDRNKLPDAIFLLAGGPGQSAISVAGWGQFAFSRLNRRRDLVFVDQRGTGRSAPLNCTELENNADMFDAEQAFQSSQKCLSRLQALPYGDLKQFTTTIAMQDLDAVRQAQGYAKINLVGVSYGTRAGLEYLRQFPQSVRRVILDGVVPPDARLPSSDAQLALDAVFADCVKDARCNAAYPRLAERWSKLLAGLPRQVTLQHPRLGSEMQILMTRDLVVSMVHKSLYAPMNVSGLPYALTQAEQGKYAPLVALSGATNLPGQGSIAYGMHFSVWCAEEYARLPDVPAADDFSRVMDGMYKKICEKWPRGNVPAEFYTLPKSPVPVLLLSGGIDPVTPTPRGAHVAEALGPLAIHLSVNNAGHGLMSQGGCLRELAYRYLNAKDDQEANKVDTSCVRQIPRPMAWQLPLPMTAASAGATGNGGKP
ncbi:alpha/beta hydrolase [Undibacterium terreum]|uniref:Alpha/beta hydrolase n=1 Tax=Undibacterium terreum TaxID=1224302 RepID=A0A916UR67_9BURK|nr:alpha/beta hydrolase [Undibacterium terreum]GGC81125.1 alpha/beta hydrolase [Undibacterium terreum]